MSTLVVTITTHTTASSPRPHILYTVQVNRNGKQSVAYRRYSEFATLHDILKDPFNLPPKRLLTTTFIPSAWVDDALIAERKTGLADYLTDILAAAKYQDNPSVYQFISSEVMERNFDPEDALPSTLSRKAALSIAATVTAAAAGEVKAAATSLYASYYPTWSAGSYPPENLDYSKFDILLFAFVTPNSSSGISWNSGDQGILQRLVGSARQSGHGTKIVLSVGGWGGCAWYSQACSNSTNRTNFVNALVGAVNTYGLDGIDIDWEYPNSPGAGNPYSASDSANLLLLVQALRTALGSSKIISAAVPHLPWLGSNGSPLTDVSAYASVMSYVNIMNYDVWGASATPGPNAPLGNLCGTSAQPQASAQAAFAQWTAAKFPANKLVLGLALYGWVSQSTKAGLTGSLMPSEQMFLISKTDKTTAKGKDINFVNGAHPRSKTAVIPEPIAATSTVVAASANLQSWWGQQIPFGTLVSSGALVKNSDGTYGQGGGFTMAWDNCSDTPFLYNVSQQTVVSYDDTWSLADKCSFAKANGMAGCFTWSLDEDDNFTLQNAIRTALGK